MVVKRLVEVAAFKVAEVKFKFVILAFKAVKLVNVAEPEAMVALAIVAVAKVETPCTLNVPVLVVEETERLLMVA